MLTPDKIIIKEFRTTPYDLNYIFRGGTFEFKTSITVSAATTKTIELKTLDGSLIHINNWNIIPTVSGSMFKFYEGSTGVTGVAYDTFNVFRRSNKISSLTISDYTVATTGNLLESYSMISGIKVSLDVPEFILKKSTSYLLEFTAGATDTNFDICFNWYESDIIFQTVNATPCIINLSANVRNNYLFNISQKTYYGYDFNGINAYIQIPPDVTIEPTVNITFEVRTKFNMADQGVTAVLGMKFLNYQLALAKITNRVDWRCNIAGTQRNVTASVAGLSTEEIHHIAGVYDGANLILYINGVLVDQAAFVGAIVQDHTNYLNIGAGGAGSSIPANNRFKGFIDEVRIWNVARSLAQIQANMLGEVDTSTSTGLVGYWKFNENSGLIANNATNPTTNIDGQIVNATRVIFSYHPNANVVQFSIPVPTVTNV